MVVPMGAKLKPNNRVSCIFLFGLIWLVKMMGTGKMTRTRSVMMLDVAIVMS
jgi:hypothetical protein